jgi:hypothetical protein
MCCNSRTSIDAFRTRIIAAKKTGVPVVNIDKTSFLYVILSCCYLLCHWSRTDGVVDNRYTRTGDMYVVAVTKQNANPAMCFQVGYSSSSALSNALASMLC